MRERDGKVKKGILKMKVFLKTLYSIKRRERKKGSREKI